MRILSKVEVETSQTTNSVKQSSMVEKNVEVGTKEQVMTQVNSSAVSDKSELSNEKLQTAINSLNEILEINHNTSKFVLHEGLDRYFVQVVDKETDEVVKEIPPKKLLDAFYEMQKLVGMIVDEKI